MTRDGNVRYTTSTKFISEMGVGDTYTMRNLENEEQLPLFGYFPTESVQEGTSF